MIRAALCLLLLIAGAAHAQAADMHVSDIVLPDVEIRPNVTVDVHLNVFTDARHACQGHVVLAVPGFAHSAATWGPFAASILDDKLAGRNVCQVIALDFPGHGGSSLPTGGLAFGNMTLGDSVVVLLAALERLPEHGIRPDTVLAHSQGGLLVQMAQQALKEVGTDLRRQFHVRRVILLAPVGPRKLPWNFAENGTAGILLSQFVAGDPADPALGVHIRIPDLFWPAVFFSDLSGFGSVPPGAPTPAELPALGFNAPEPLRGALELVGAPPFARPLVDAGIFAPDAHTALLVVSFEQDTIIRPKESARLYEHLTGDLTRAGVVEIRGADAVHDMYIADPDRLSAELAEIKVH